VAQTRIIFNEKELLQLIHHHLMKKGLTKTAALLHSEAELPTNVGNRNSLWPSTPVSHNRVVSFELHKDLIKIRIFY
jgi:HIV-1 Vpr-binding protein